MTYTAAQIHEAQVSWYRYHYPDLPPEVAAERAGQHFRAMALQGREPVEAIAMLAKLKDDEIARERKALRSAHDQARTATATEAIGKHLDAPETKRELDRAAALEARGDERSRREAGAIRSQARTVAAAKGSREAGQAWRPKSDDEIQAEAIAAVRSRRPYLWPSWEGGAAPSSTTAPKRTRAREVPVSDAAIRTASLRILGASSLRTAGTTAAELAAVFAEHDRPVAHAERMAALVDSCPAEDREALAATVLATALRTPKHATPEQRAILVLGTVIKHLADASGGAAKLTERMRAADRKRTGAAGRPVSSNSIGGES